MKTFKDSKDRNWSLEINCDSIEQIKADCGCNVLDVLDPQSDLSQEIMAYPPLAAKLIFAAVAEQAKIKEVDDREFRRSMNGDALSAAHDALMEEIINFSPKYRRNVAAAVLEKNRDVQNAAAELAMIKLQDPELKTKIMTALETALRREMEIALERMGGREPDSATESLSAVGMPPASSDSPAPDLTPGETLPA
ncbi:MAG: hypothetical protein ACLP9L_18240 [Thermoguttaceae bacterium]